MNAYENQIRNYRSLNALSAKGGAVLFGGTEDREIPVCELKQSFGLDLALFNRSVSGLTLDRAAEAYDRCAAPLAPESVLLHLGAEDLGRFAEDPDGFDRDYRALIAHIRAADRGCEITVITLKNPEELPEIAELNRHLKFLAASERCEFCDIGARRVWNPAALRETIGFMYSTGFVRPLQKKLPAYDLVKLLYCYDCEQETATAPETGKQERARRIFAGPKVSFT